MKAHRLVAALAALTGALALVVGPLPRAAAAAAPYCGITWGSLPKSAAGIPSPIAGARVGKHDCFDRFVIDLRGMPPAGYRVRYVDVVTSGGSGEALPVSGGAKLQIDVVAPGHDENYQPTVPWAYKAHIVSPSQFSARGFRTFRDLVWGATFEGQSVFGLGVRARLPFRVFKLDGPGTASRVVVGVAHRW